MIFKKSFWKFCIFSFITTYSWMSPKKPPFVFLVGMLMLLKSKHDLMTLLVILPSSMSGYFSLP